MDSGGRYIATLSGGPDSVALLVMLSRLGYDVVAAHCNFHLRGKEADRDEAFCRKLCSDMGIELHVVHFDTFGYAAEHKVSIEMAARELRYDFFERLRRELSADGICVAHHINDSVETVIMNLIRGTGIRGLKGISARNGYILRPLLCITRADIEKYLSDNGIGSVTDSSNLVNDVTRNRIRLDIIPMMEQINGSAVMNMARTAHRVDEALKVFDDAMCRAVNEVCTGDGEYSTERLMHTVSPEYTLFTILEKYGFSPAQTEDIFANIGAAPGTEYSSATHRMLFDRDRFIIRPITNDECMPVVITSAADGEYVFDSRLSFSLKCFDRNDDFVIKKNRSVAVLDAGRLSFPLTIRTVQTGDRFVPFGMKGSKLLSDYMTDRKFSKFRKQQQSVITDSNGNIVWVTDERPDARFCISDATIRVIEISVVKL